MALFLQTTLDCQEPSVLRALFAMALQDMNAAYKKLNSALEKELSANSVTPEQTLAITQHKATAARTNGYLMAAVDEGLIGEQVWFEAVRRQLERLTELRDAEAAYRKRLADESLQLDLKVQNMQTVVTTLGHLIEMSSLE